MSAVPFDPPMPGQALPKATSLVPAGWHPRLPVRWAHVKVFGFTRGSLVSHAIPGHPMRSPLSVSLQVWASLRGCGSCPLVLQQ